MLTVHGKPVAKIVPVGENDKVRSQAVLVARLRSQAVHNVGRWTRDELYESKS